MMKYLTICLIAIIAMSCEEPNKDVRFKLAPGLEENYVENELPDSLISGQSYLPIYSQIYSRTMGTKYLTTATISMRNVNLHDTIYINKINYFDSEGTNIRTYIKKAIYLKPMETKEIVIEYLDQEGGTGANFHFDWSCKETSNKPFFQAVMVTITGSFGLSFTTEGIDLK